MLEVFNLNKGEDTPVRQFYCKHLYSVKKLHLILVLLSGQVYLL